MPCVNGMILRDILRINTMKLEKPELKIEKMLN